MRFTKKSRLLTAGIAAASFSLLGVTPASAAVTSASTAVKPAIGCDVSFPNWTQTTDVIGQAEGVTYTLHLSHGTLEASWADNYNTLIIAYVKTGGSEITADFQQYGYHEDGDCYFTDDDGAFTMPTSVLSSTPPCTLRGRDTSQSNSTTTTPAAERPHRPRA